MHHFFAFHCSADLTWFLTWNHGCSCRLPHQNPSFSTLRHVAREVFNNNNIWMKWTTIQFAFSGNVSNTFARHDKFISISNQHCLSRNKDHLVWQLPPAATTCFNCWCFKAKSRVCTDSSPISLWSQWTLFTVHSTVCRLYSVHTGLTICCMHWIVNSVSKIPK